MKRKLLFALMVVFVMTGFFVVRQELFASTYHVNAPNGFPTSCWGTPCCMSGGKQCWVSNGSGPGTGRPLAIAYEESWM